jgi:hypothetical protein
MHPRAVLINGNAGASDLQLWDHDVSSEGVGRGGGTGEAGAERTGAGDDGVWDGEEGMGQGGGAIVTERGGGMTEGGGGGGGGGMRLWPCWRMLLPMI